jgi:hypothetical protein
LNILDIKEPVLVEDILPPSENLEILKHLAGRDFKIQHEGKEDKFSSGFLNDYKHVGMALVNYDINDELLKTNPLDPLFIWARIITSIISHKLKINYFNKINRIHYNYYYKDQEGIGHIDNDKNNFVSILYNLHTTDGGTEILNKFFPDKMGQAKIFKSNWYHKGICVKKDKARSSLNIVLEY